jgi:HlyD family secretion protein
MPDVTSLPRQQEGSLISEEIQEIISYRPHWIIRKGNSIFFLIALMLLSLTWIIHYPDVIYASARLEAINAPKLLVAKTEGKLERLLVANNQQVKEGQHLAYLQSIANHKQVLELKKWLALIIDRTKNNNLNDLASYPSPPLSQLGELQASYQEFENILIETKEVLSSGYYQQKKAALQKDLLYLATLKKNSNGQNVIENVVEMQG